MRRLLKPVNNKPWLCIGDFNEILYQHEKFGGASRAYAQMKSFGQALQDC